MLGLALMYFIISGLWLAALHLPHFGKWWLGSGWPPLFTNPHHHSAALLRARLTAGTYAAIASGCGSTVIMRLLGTPFILRWAMLGLTTCISLVCLGLVLRQNAVLFRK